MKIKDFDLDEKVMVVAEIGNNHEGDFDTARRMVETAAKAGVDAVKFQTFVAKYFVRGRDKERFERMSSFELDPGQFGELAEQAKGLGLIFISTPLDMGSVDVLEGMVDAYKIASGDNDFYALIDKVCAKGKPMIVSSGLADIDQISKTVDRISGLAGGEIKSRVALLHCVTNYPVEPHEANLLSMTALKERFGLTVGYSDHTLGVEACVAATALGARIIEKHFTLDKNFSDFRDHQISSDPAEMAGLVEKIGRVSDMLGDGEIKIEKSEMQNRPLVRRSIVAGADIDAGRVIQMSDLSWMRPADGLAPGEEVSLIGKSLKISKKLGETIVPEDVQ